MAGHSIDQNGDGALTPALRLFQAAIAVCAITMVYLAGAKGTWHWFAPLLLAILASSAASWAVRRWRRGPAAERLTGALVSATILTLALVVPELALRTGGFRFEAGIGFAPDGAFQRYRTDGELFWRWKDGELNSLGYPAAEPLVPKPDDVFRILYLGDSCTWDSYPEVVEALLAPVLASRGRSVETINLAVPGYSSHQGRILAQKYGAWLEPDLVVVMFGWNDQWRAIGAVDAEKVVHARDASRTGALVSRFRLLQGAAYMMSRLGPAEPLLEEPRVPPHAFVENLAAIGSIFPDRPVIAMTPPTGHHRLGVPDELSRAFDLHADTIIARHRAYAALARDVAAANGWLLLDLKRELAPHPLPDRIFTRDGIHYTRAGKAVIGEILAHFIRDRVLHAPARTQVD